MMSHFRHGDFHSQTVQKLGLNRHLYICHACLVNARSAADSVFKAVKCLEEVLDSLSECDEDLLKMMEVVFVKLASMVHLGLKEDTQMEHMFVKTIDDLKYQAKSKDFLCSSQRSSAVIEGLLALSGIDPVYSKSVKSLSMSKQENLCLAYESLMGLSNANLTTAPSIYRNIKLLKAVHSKGLLAEVGYPTGGSYPLLQSLCTTTLPELLPPSVGDFVSADDNIQVREQLSNLNIFAECVYSEG